MSNYIYQSLIFKHTSAISQIYVSKPNIQTSWYYCDFSAKKIKKYVWPKYNVNGGSGNT